MIHTSLSKPKKVKQQHWDEMLAFAEMLGARPVHSTDAYVLLQDEGREKRYYITMGGPLFYVRAGKRYALREGRYVLTHRRVFNVIYEKMVWIPVGTNSEH